MDENKYTTAFTLILNAGDAKSNAMMAVEAAREFDFVTAEAYLKKAEEDMRKAHQAQVDLIQQEAGGTPVEVNIILVHAQDHLTMALMAHDNAEEFIHLYKMIQELSVKCGMQQDD